MTKVLIIDDVPWLSQLQPHLRPLGFRIAQELEADRWKAAVIRETPDLVLLDLHFPEDRYDSEQTTGGRLHTALRHEFPHIPVLIFSTRTEDDSLPPELLEVEPLGRINKPDPRAADWARPFAERLKQAITAFDALKIFTSLGFEVGRTPSMLKLFQELWETAGQRAAVLLRGEAGVGKRLAAETLHRLGRRTGRFVVLDKAAYGPEGKPRAPAEFVADAAEGTLLLARIEEFDQRFLASLFGVIYGLETAAKATPKARVRVIATTRLERGVPQDGPLADLLSRLGRFELWLPPLRERLNDLPALFRRAVDKHNKTASVPISRHLRPEVRVALASHGWPENIREFNDAIRTAATGTQNETLLLENFSWLPVRFAASQPSTPAEPAKNDDPLTGLARSAFKRIQALPQGNDRYDAFKRTDKKAKPLVVQFIKNHLHGTTKGETVERVDVAIYFLGRSVDPTTIRSVSTYLTRNGWRSRKKTAEK